ncbi:MAG: hypothetical protein N3A59_04615 [Thermodesulfovibrionales bacterium]|nr:hypothetical protein [Thermodesulfovibrionales bacterium]
MYKTEPELEVFMAEIIAQTINEIKGKNEIPEETRVFLRKGSYTASKTLPKNVFLSGIKEIAKEEQPDMIVIVTKAIAKSVVEAEEENAIAVMGATPISEIFIVFPYVYHHHIIELNEPFELNLSELGYPNLFDEIWIDCIKLN